MCLLIFRHFFNFFPHITSSISPHCFLQNQSLLSGWMVWILIFSQLLFYYQVLPLYYIAKEHLRHTSPQDPFALFSQNVPRLLSPFLPFSGFHKDLDSPECPPSTVLVSNWLALEGLSTSLHLSVTLTSPPSFPPQPIPSGFVLQ